MRLHKWAAYVAGVMTIILGAASTARGQAVTFSDLNDAVPSKYFDAAASAADAADPNKLIIGFNTGLDPASWTANDFKASTAAFSRPSAMDTISFSAHAPAGFYIAKITYTQRGSGSIARTGKAAGGSNWVVGGFASNLGLFGTNPTLSSTADLTGMNLTSVPVSITTALFAFSTPQLGSATVAVTSADVVVELLPLIE
jgi:hypothetical protein